MRLAVILSLTLHTVFISLVYYTYTNDNNVKNKDIELTVADFFTHTQKINTAQLKENYLIKTSVKKVEKTKEENYKYEDINIKDENIPNPSFSSIVSENSEDINMYINSVETGIINGVVLPIPPYPAIAKKKGMTGKSIIDIFIDENGKIISANVFLSSGYKVLDNAAKETILKSWRLPAPGKKIVIRKIFYFELID